MPNQDEHAEYSLKMYGVEARDIHEWLDAPVTLKGPSHRAYARHDPDIIHHLPKNFITKYGSDLAQNIVIDHLVRDSRSSEWRPQMVREEREKREIRRHRETSRSAFWIAFFIVMIPVTYGCYLLASTSLIISAGVFIFFLICFAIIWAITKSAFRELMDWAENEKKED